LPSNNQRRCKLRNDHIEREEARRRTTTKAAIEYEAIRWSVMCQPSRMVGTLSYRKALLVHLRLRRCSESNTFHKPTH